MTGRGRGEHRGGKTRGRERGGRYSNSAASGLAWGPLSSDRTGEGSLPNLPETKTCRCQWGIGELLDHRVQPGRPLVSWGAGSRSGPRETGGEQPVPAREPPPNTSTSWTRRVGACWLQRGLDPHREPPAWPGPSRGQPPTPICPGHPSRAGGSAGSFTAHGPPGSQASSRKPYHTSYGVALPENRKEPTPGRPCCLQTHKPLGEL